MPSFLLSIPVFLAATASVTASGLKYSQPQRRTLEESGPKCKCIPEDVCWPSAWEWTQLNRTVGGRLIATEPLGKVCHYPSYDAEACAQVQEVFDTPAPQ